MTARRRTLSGIKPSGKLHLGNYLGMLKPALELQSTHDVFYFIADYHALTTVRNGTELHENIYDLVAAFAALGMDFEAHTFFRQSDVPEVTELSWILGTVTGKGLMDRAHSYKDKVAKKITPSMGLYCYPVLMAADILIYRSDLVPVGKDQVQHIEMAQDMAATSTTPTAKCSSGPSPSSTTPPSSPASTDRR